MLAYWSTIIRSAFWDSLGFTGHGWRDLLFVSVLLVLSAWRSWPKRSLRELKAHPVKAAWDAVALPIAAWVALFLVFIFVVEPYQLWNAAGGHAEMSATSATYDATVRQRIKTSQAVIGGLTEDLNRVRDEQAKAAIKAPPAESRPIVDVHTTGANSPAINGDNASVVYPKPAPRRLSSEQKAELVQLLRPYPPGDVKLLRMPAGKELIQFADDFVAVFKSLGWKLDADESAIVPEGWSGLAVVVHSQYRHPKAADVFVTSVQAMGFEIAGGINDQIPVDQLFIKIGPQE